MDPFTFFNEWYKEAEKANVIEPYSFVLSTINSRGEPRSRVVLWRRFIDNVFYFFTNYKSDKATEIENSKKVAMNFHWRLPQHRQVRIEGVIQKASKDISDEYFSTRPRGSQLGAWSSPQSRTISGKKDVEVLVNTFDQTFHGRDVTRPEFWGGYGISPHYFEFWEEGESRIHTRIVFSLVDNQWQQKMIAP